MGNVLINVPLAQFQHFNGVDMAAASIEIVVRVPGETVFPEAPTRDNFQNLLYLINAQMGVEVGVQIGDYSEHLLQNWEGTLFLVDAWQHYGGYQDVANVTQDEQATNYQTTVEKIGRFGERARIVRGFSTDVAPRFYDQPLDFVYLDANHSYEAVTADLKSWLPALRTGGLMAGHDFVNYSGPLGVFGVKQAVVDFVQEHGFRLFVSREWWPSLWYFVKR
jgi:cephalosporin hydroxylase